MKFRSGLLLAALSAISITSNAANITVLGHNNAPMFLDGGTGREGDVITAVLEHCGHSVSFEIQPFVRHWESFKNGAGDAVASVPVGMDLGGAATVPYFFYQNGISMLAGKHGSVKDVAGLAGKKVVAFKGADHILPELKGKTGSFKQYREVSDQAVHSRLLFAKRVDAVVGDGMIFAEYIQSLRNDNEKKKFDPDQAVEFKSIFAPSARTLVFRNSSLAADFDRCFKEVEADGTIAKINSAWTDKYRDVLGNEYMGY